MLFVSSVRTPALIVVHDLRHGTTATGTKDLKEGDGDARLQLLKGLGWAGSGHCRLRGFLQQQKQARNNDAGVYSIEMNNYSTNVQNGENI